MILKKILNYCRSSTFWTVPRLDSECYQIYSINTNPNLSNTISTTNNNKNNTSLSTSPTRKTIAPIIPITSISDLRIIAEQSGIDIILAKYIFCYTPLHLACCGGNKYVIF